MPFDELRARQVVVTNSSGVHAINMAEHVLAMMLAFARQLPHLVRGQLAHEWRDDETRDQVFELFGQRLLLVGVGDIALGVAERAAAFGMRITGVRRRPRLVASPAIERIVGIDQLQEAMAAADHIVVSLPLTHRTKALFNAEVLGWAKPGAYLYNIGRGPVIDGEALIAALTSGQFGGAGLDVTDPEPLPADSPLWEMANVLITAHTAGGTPRYWDRGIEILETNIERFVTGAQLVNVVDLVEGY